MITGAVLLAALQVQAAAVGYRHKEAPEVRASPVGDAIVIDGRLDEPDWLEAEPASTFTQLDPFEGREASERTEVRILVGEDALYVGARLFDREPGRIVGRLTRRDFPLDDSDAFQVILDTYHDHLTAFGFTVTPAGAIRDVAIGADGEEDESWDGVWDAAATTDSLGWTAELRIPLSELRYRRQIEAEWGIQLSRRIVRKQETSLFAFTPKAEQAGVNRYGHLVGLGRLDTPRRLEVLPHTVARAEFAPAEVGDPFRDGSAYTGDVGFELEYKVSPGLVLNATVNPDFGQVEADPADVNLSDFETRYDEKRPFFVEGQDVFRFGRLRALQSADAPEFFFSRRIGKEPSLNLHEEWVDAPEVTTIGGAAKLSGKVGGWSVGVLDAVTPEENGRFFDAEGVRGSAPIEPLSNYLVGRVTREMEGSDTQIGGFLTAVHRDLSTTDLAEELRSSAYAAGVDVNHAWKDRTWALDLSLAVSDIRGSAEVIDDAQRSSARYYQRPDATHLDYDPGRTGLTGHALQLALSKLAGLHWRASVAYQEVSPGLEVNDLGYQRRADQRILSAEAQYRQQQPTRLFRRWRVSGSIEQGWNFAGESVGTQLGTSFSTQLHNYWQAYGYLHHDLGSLDPRLTRGGPMARSPEDWSAGLSVVSDDRGSVYLLGDLYYNNDSAGGRTIAPSLYVSMKPSPSVKVRVGPWIEWSRSTSQYVTRTSDTLAVATYGKRYIFSTIDQTTLALSTRLDWTFSQRASLQFYGQVFVGSGDYHEFKELETPRTFRFRSYERGSGTIERDQDGRYTVDPDGSGPAAAFGFSDPNFNQRSLRGTTVLRWEVLPGSTIYLAWQHRRSDYAYVGDFSLGRDVRALFGTPSRNVFVVKGTYWLGL
jgi:hypothetical protein